MKVGLSSSVGFEHFGSVFEPGMAKVQSSGYRTYFSKETTTLTPEPGSRLGFGVYCRRLLTRNPMWVIFQASVLRSIGA